MPVRERATAVPHRRCVRHDGYFRRPRSRELDVMMFASVGVSCIGTACKKGRWECKWTPGSRNDDIF